MQSFNVTANVPESRRIEICLPPEVPTGLAELEIRLLPEPATVEISIPPIDLAKLPKYFDNVTGVWKPVERSGVVREVSAKP